MHLGARDTQEVVAENLTSQAITVHVQPEIINNAVSAEARMNFSTHAECIVSKCAVMSRTTNGVMEQLSPKSHLKCDKHIYAFNGTARGLSGADSLQRRFGTRSAS